MPCKTWKGPEARASTFRIRRGRKSRGSQPQRRGSRTKDCWTYCARHRNSRTKSLWTTSGVSVLKSDRARTRLPRSSFQESRHWKPDLGSAPEPGRNRLHPLQPVKRANLEGEMLRHAVGAAASDGHVRPAGNGGPTSPQIVIQEPGGSGLNGVLRSMRQSGPSNTPPWEAGAQPFGDRLAAFEQRCPPERMT